MAPSARGRGTMPRRLETYAKSVRAATSPDLGEAHLSPLSEGGMTAGVHLLRRQGSGMGRKPSRRRDWRRDGTRWRRRRTQRLG